MAETVIKLRLNQQQLELMDRTIAQGVAADRVALVRLALLENPKVAWRLAVAHMVAPSGNWTVDADDQSSRSNAIRESLAKSAAQAGSCCPRW